MLMAQQGADVIKVEPQGGDWARLIGGVYGDHTAYSIVANMGKRAISLNLKQDDARTITDTLIKPTRMCSSKATARRGRTAGLTATSGCPR